MKNRNCIVGNLVFLCGMAVLSSSFAAERPPDPGVNARPQAQRGRIQQGVQSGNLTAGEAKSPKQGEKVPRPEERAYKSDGKVTVAERKDLHHDANQVSRDIHRQKRDVQAKPVAIPPPLPPRRRSPLANARQGAPQARIAQGEPSGGLSRPEAAGLRPQERAVRAEERADKSDGKLTAAERRGLRQDLNGDNKKIHQQKHDAPTPANPPLTPAAR